MRERAPNRLKLLESRALVVSVEVNGAVKPRQVRSGETNVSELSMTCRKVSRWCRNRARWLAWDEGRGKPVDCSTGTRHEGGVTLVQASMRNVGTCRPDAKGDIQADNLRKDQRTDAGHRGGDARSRAEGPVMGLDRRGVVVRLLREHNLQREDARG